MERSKDPILGFRSVIQGQNKKGGDRIQLYLGGHTDERGNQAIQQLIDSLTEALNNPKGVKLDIHIQDKTTNDGSRTFKSAFGFVKPVEDGPGGQQAAAAPKRFVPKAPASKLNKTIG